MAFPKHQLSPRFEHFVSKSYAPPHSLAPPKTNRMEREELKAYFVNAWALYDWLFSGIADPRAFYQQPDNLRHPLVFYLGHTAAFYINKMVMAGVFPKGINPHFERLFARGVDPESPEELSGPIDWPELEAVWAYRQEVFDKVMEAIDKAHLSEPVNEDHPYWSLLMGIEHDRIHFETSSVLIRQYPLEVVRRPEGWTYAPMNKTAPVQTMVTIPSGSVRLGKETGFPTFGWDNEYGHLKTEVAPFEISKNLVTNGEYLPFVMSEAYNERYYWTRAGWVWKEKAQKQHPQFWIPQEEGFAYRAMFDQLEMPLDWPVEVNCFEAEAFCRWQGHRMRLPTEAEFNRVARGLMSDREELWDVDGFNLNLKYGSPSPVGSLPNASSLEGVNDVYGNLWNWLKDDFYPLPGFKTHPLYEDFSSPYFDNQHAMMLGGAWATTGTGASRFYRLWFRRFFYQHAGFRMARDLLLA